METKRNFFDLLALADVERVHSAVIGWLLSDECEALTKEERSAVLNSLFGRNDDVVYETIEVRLEWKHIDILWLTKSKSQGKECWVLENKVKSSQHGNQLDDYVDAINESEDPAIKGARAHYAYLTLTGEPAKCQNHEIRYESCTYKKLVKEFEGYFPKGYLHPNPDWTIANEYFKAIQRMTRVTDAFLEDPAKFPHVFIDGNKRMDAKLKSDQGKPINDDDRYIASRGLETLLQKYYFYDIVKEVVGGDIAPLIENWHVGQTRGNADMGFHFGNYLGRTQDEGDHFDISFQAGTFKFAVSYKYNSPETRRDAVRSKFRGEWEDIFRSLKKEYRCTQINCGKSCSRISICYPITPGKNWYELSRQEFVSILKSEVMKALEMRSKAIRMYEEKMKTKGE